MPRAVIAYGQRDCARAGVDIAPQVETCVFATAKPGPASGQDQAFFGRSSCPAIAVARMQVLVTMKTRLSTSTL